MKNFMPNLFDVCDYIILKVTEEKKSLNILKLQKLLYYVQAWHLALYKTPLFEGKFQAWVHGPVNREIYDRFSLKKMLYSDLSFRDIGKTFRVENLSKKAQNHINDVLEVYAKYTGSQLEEFTHRELPWIEARKGYNSIDRCEIEIDENLMRRYYSDLMKK